MLKTGTLTLKREGIPSPAVAIAPAENAIEVSITLSGKKLNFIYAIPDAAGTIMATNQNEQWIEERLKPLLRQLFGKIV